MRYFLVDCRPVDHFSCGHLAKSFHLDANLVGGCHLHAHSSPTPASLPTTAAVLTDRLCRGSGSAV